MDLDKKILQEIERSQEIMYGELLNEQIKPIVRRAIDKILKSSIDDVIKTAIRTMKAVGTKVDDFAKLKDASFKEILKRIESTVGTLTKSERAAVFRKLQKNLDLKQKLQQAQKSAVGSTKYELMVLPKNTAKYELANISRAAKSEITPFVKNEIAVLNKTGISNIGDFKKFLPLFEKKGVIKVGSNGVKRISRKNLWALAILLGVGYLLVNDEAKKNGVIPEGSSDNIIGGSEYKQKNVQKFIPIPVGKDVPVFSTPKGTVWKKSKNGAFAEVRELMT